MGCGSRRVGGCGGKPSPPGRGDYQSPVLWEIRMSWEDGRLIAAPTAPLRGAWRPRRDGPARGPGPTGRGPWKTGGSGSAQPARKRGKRSRDRSSTSQQPLSEVSSRGEKLLQGTRSGARRQEPPSLHPNQAGTTPAHGETWPHGQVLAQAFFSFGPCTARFLFGKTKKKMGGAKHQLSS